MRISMIPATISLPEISAFKASRRPVLILAILPALLFAAKNQDWKTGKVLDSQTAKTYVQMGSTTTATATATGNSASASAQTTIQSMAIRDTPWYRACRNLLVSA
jgi:hypothetical protein